MGYRVLLIGLFVTAVAYTVAARFIPMDVWTAEETVNAQTLPTLYGAALCLTLAFLFFQSPVHSTHAMNARLVRMIGICALVLVFILLLSLINLWIALGLLLALLGWWLGERRWLPLALLAVLVPLGGYLGIELALGVYLPG